MFRIGGKDEGVFRKSLAEEGLRPRLAMILETQRELCWLLYFSARRSLIAHHETASVYQRDNSRVTLVRCCLGQPGTDGSGRPP